MVALNYGNFYSSAGAPPAGYANYNYIISQNAAGTVYSAYDSSGNLITSNSTPDIAPILNTLLSNLATAGQGGKILILAGKYKIAGTWTVDPNNSGYYYLIGVPVVSTSANTMNITIEGESSGGAGQIYTAFSLSGMGGNALNNVGVQLITNQASTSLPGANGNSVFYVLKNSAGFSGTNYLSITMHNLRWTQQTNIWTSTNNWFTMVDASFAGGFNGGTLVCDTVTNNSAVMSQMNSPNNMAVRFPNGSNQGSCHFDMINVAGYGIGVYLLDHANISYLYCEACESGIGVANNSHAADVFVYNVQQCQTWIALLSNQANLNVWNLDPEPTTGISGTNSWQDFLGVFNNTFQTFTGTVNINYGPAGPNGEFSSLNSPGLGTMPAASTTSGGHTYISAYTLRFIGNPSNAVTGTTAGSATWCMPEMGSNYKKVVVNLSGYENTSGTSQTITFPVAFVNTPTLVTDASGGASVSTTALTLPHGMSGTKTGLISIEGA